MSQDPIRFDDGAAYERMMGVWSRLVGIEFIDWLSPESGGSWIDVGCGNGAFTELLAQHCAPSAILGIDPSAGQLEYARSRPGTNIATFEQGDAVSLPSADDTFDAAVMALVIFFVSEPAAAVAEMQRVVKPGGLVSAYAWDVLHPGGFPMAPLQEELRALGRTPAMPPRADASTIEALTDLWRGAGLVDVVSRTITVSRSFADFEDFWASVQIAIGMTQHARPVPEDDIAKIRQRLDERMVRGPDGEICYTARANAIRGRVTV